MRSHATLTLLVLIASALRCQGQSSTTGVITGQVVDADSHQVVTTSLRISAAKTGPRGGLARSALSANGGFELQGLEAGTYEIRATELNNRFPVGRRMVRVSPGATSNGADVVVHRSAIVNGFVLGSDREPVQGARVLLVASEYWDGRLIFYAEQERTVDDRGHYAFMRLVQSGRPYLLLVLPPRLDEEIGRSGTRKPTLEAAWFPGPPSQDGLSDLVLRSGEERRIDLTMTETPSLCVDGTLTVDGRGAPVDFEVAIAEISGYVPADGLSHGVVGTGRSGLDGRFQMCGLWAGDFKLFSGLRPEQYGSLALSISDKDLHNINLDAGSSIMVSGTVKPEVSNGEAALPQMTTIVLTAFDRPRLPGEPFSYRIETSRVGEFRVSLPATSEYLLTGSGDATSYIKAVLCGGAVVEYIRVSSGQQAACKLEVIVGAARGKLVVKVLDDQSAVPTQPVSVCVAPTSASSRGRFADALRCSSIDPETGSALFNLPPGKYSVLVDEGANTSITRAPTPTWIEQLWTRRGLSKTVELNDGAASSGSVTATISTR